MASNILSPSENATLTLYYCFKFIFFSPDPLKMGEVLRVLEFSTWKHKSDNINISVNELLFNLKLCLILETH